MDSPPHSHLSFLNIGSQVEVCSDKDGLIGAWFVATVQILFRASLKSTVKSSGEAAPPPPPKSLLLLISNTGIRPIESSKPIYISQIQDFCGSIGKRDDEVVCNAYEAYHMKPLEVKMVDLKVGQSEDGEKMKIGFECFPISMAGINS
ncbi:hypothetical protein L6452_19084 [Arctium lappa]|uniref:Uncharacterized protein n=1 Tax=Arctium lappa TaxID=4217 RepID=A0ACB9B6W4_ARCLA|nr:hypothetical protein L6452_19084 [Arctium lappa]